MSYVTLNIHILVIVLVNIIKFKFIFNKKLNKLCYVLQLSSMQLMGNLLMKTH